MLVTVGVWRISHAEFLVGLTVMMTNLSSPGEAGMQRYPDNLSAEDRRTHRRWTRGLFLFYSAAIAVAMGVAFINRPATELRASNETRTAGLKVTTGSTAISPVARLAPKP